MNPFAPWLPMYRPGTVPDRPMWHHAPTGNKGERYARIDGIVVYATADRRPVWEAVAPGMESALLDREPMPLPRAGGPDETWPARILESLIALTDRLAVTRPVAAPPPMVGQVWVDHEHGQYKIEGITPAGMPWRMEVYLSDTGETWAYGVNPWPPPSAVLVAGPTPWGRDVPWYPTGWRP